MSDKAFRDTARDDIARQVWEHVRVHHKTESKEHERTRAEW